MYYSPWLLFVIRTPLTISNLLSGLPCLNITFIHTFIHSFIHYIAVQHSCCGWDHTPNASAQHNIYYVYWLYSINIQHNYRPLYNYTSSDLVKIYFIVSYQLWHHNHKSTCFYTDKQEGHETACRRLKPSGTAWNKQVPYVCLMTRIATKRREVSPSVACMPTVFHHL